MMTGLKALGFVTLTLLCLVVVVTQGDEANNQTSTNGKANSAKSGNHIPDFTNVLKMIQPFLKSNQNNSMANSAKSGNQTPDFTNILKMIQPFLQSNQNNPMASPASSGFSNILKVIQPFMQSNQIKSMASLSGSGTPMSDFTNILKMIQPFQQSNQNNSMNGTGPKLPFSFTEKLQQCQEDLMEVGRGLMDGEKWALKMFDATGKPESGLMRGNLRFAGDLKECEGVTHKYPYNSSRYIEGKMCGIVIPTRGKQLQINLRWDVCLPTSCQANDLTIILNIIAKLESFGGTPFAVCSKDFDPDISDDKNGIIAITILAIFGVLMVLGTVTEMYIKYKKVDPSVRITKKTSDEKAVLNKGFELNETMATDQIHPVSKEDGVMDPKNKDVTTVSSIVALENDTSTSCNGPEPNKKRNAEDISGSLSLWTKAILAFSIPHNTKKIMSVKSTPGAIGCLHGVRVLSMGWVILGHIILLYSQEFSKNPRDVLEWIQTLGSQIITNATLSVDTFFLMSGLLTSYVFLKKLGKKGRITIKEIIMYYVHRYWRLTPSMMIWIMIVATLLKYIGKGNSQYVGDFLGKSCRDNWWTNILYINNVYKQKGGCLGVTWYLANDMQFYFIAPLALIPWLYGYRVVGFLVSLIYVAIHWSSTIWLENSIDGDRFSILAQRQDKIYFKPYTRIAPFAIGMMLGWILWKRNGKANLNKGLVFLGWALSIGLVLILTLVSYDDIKHPWSHAGRMVEWTLYRSLWAIAVGWIIFACTTGYGGYVNSILSWEGWLPLSRLTYSAYLIHLDILMYTIFSRDYGITFNQSSVSYEFIGFFVISYAVGFLLTVTVESPMLVLEKVIFEIYI